jgi:hypothetical protein
LADEDCPERCRPGSAALDNRRRRQGRAGGCKRLRIGDTTSGAEDAQELIALAAKPAKQAEFLQDHSPGDYGEEKKQPQDDAGNQTRLFKNATKVGGKGCKQEKRNVSPSV